MVKNWDCDYSPKYSKAVEGGVFVLWRWWSHILGIAGVIPTLLHTSQTITNHPAPDVVGVNICSGGWRQCFHLRNCSDYVFSILLKAMTQEIVATLIDYHQGTDKVCGSDGQRRVLASYKDFGDHLWGRSAEKQASVEECSRLTQLRKVMHSIHLVLHQGTHKVCDSDGQKN